MAVLAVGLAAALLSTGQPAPAGPDDGPRFTRDGKMLPPTDYREWVFLSSGLGMTYGPRASPTDPRFDNVFVNRSAYHTFLKTGTWPDHAVLVLEVRASASKGSINQGGHFQSGLVGIEAHVKEEKRFADKWAFFGFDQGDAPAEAFPAGSRCQTCHAKDGAVDTTFVQFYPTLAEVARREGTMR